MQCPKAVQRRVIAWLKCVVTLANLRCLHSTWLPWKYWSIESLVNIFYKVPWNEPRYVKRAVESRSKTEISVTITDKSLVLTSTLFSTATKIWFTTEYPRYAVDWCFWNTVGFKRFSITSECFQSVLIKEILIGCHHGSKQNKWKLQRVAFPAEISETPVRFPTSMENANHLNELSSKIQHFKLSTAH